ncbi:MAG: hypothetical protein EXR93_02600 [Gemmatimonadetes bacterium]|nr:hypothetical protein [Gemmatimonadota bacterium]
MTGAGPTVRVWVPDVWDIVELTTRPAETVADVKAAALSRAIGPTADPANFEMKYRGARVDESRTLAELQVPAGAPMIVLPVHRRPVR